MYMPHAERERMEAAERAHGRAPRKPPRTVAQSVKPDQLVDRLTARIVRLMATHPQSPPTAIDPSFLAARAAQHATTSVEAMVDAADRSRVLQLQVFADRWPLAARWPPRSMFAGMVATGDDEVDRTLFTLGCLGEDAPIIDVAPVRVAEALERSGDGDARVIASRIRGGAGAFRVELRHGERIAGTPTLTLLSPWGSAEMRSPVPEAQMRAALLIAHAVQLVAVSRTNVSAPTQMIELVRDGRVEGGTILDGGIHMAPDITMSIRVLPRPGIGLLLPWEGVKVRSDGRTVSLRQVLTGSMDRTYLCTMAAYRDYGDRTGLFEWDEKTILGEYLGIQRYEANGSKDFPSNVKNALRRDFEQLSNIHVTDVGDVSARWPEPLVQTYRDRRGRHPAIYRHAPIVVSALRVNYTQCPRAIMRIDARDVSIAIALAALIRRRAIAILKAGGAYEAPITEWCGAAGVDTDAGVRKEGHSFWTTVRDRLARIVGSSTLGTLTFTGNGPDAVGKLQVDGALLSGYELLLRQQEDAIEEERQAREATERPRSPRKLPPKLSGSR
jgi:hypothetical protein